MRKNDAAVANGEFRHAGDGHADAADFTTQEIEYFDQAGGPVDRVGNAERDTGFDDRVAAHPHRKRVHIDHVADENHVRLLDEIAKRHGKIRGRLDGNGGQPDREQTREPKTHPVSYRHEDELVVSPPAPRNVNSCRDLRD